MTSMSCRAHGMKLRRDPKARCRATAVYVDDLPLFGGSDDLEGQPADRRQARGGGALLAHQRITHSYMHCWRHKTPVIYRATAQWFVGMDVGTAAKDGQDAARDGAGRHRGDPVLPGLGQGAAARHDRQPARLVHLAPAQLGRADARSSCTRTSGELHPRTLELMEAAAERVEAGGIEAWPRSIPPSCSGDEAERLRQESPTPSTCGSTPARPTGTCCAARTRAAATSRARGRPVPGRLRPAPRLVPFVAADRRARSTAIRRTGGC